MHLAIQKIEKKFIKKIPVIRPGYTVRVHQKIREGEKERVQIFEGLVIGFNAGSGASKTMRVRKIIEGIGVEKIYPLYSPVIAKIEVKKTPKVRRAKLFYMRNLSGKSARLRTKTGLSEKDLKFGKKDTELAEGMGVSLESPAVNEEKVASSAESNEENTAVAAEVKK